jgi:hypothetical protein
LILSWLYVINHKARPRGVYETMAVPSEGKYRPADASAKDAPFGWFIPQHEFDRYKELPTNRTELHSGERRDRAG